MKKVFFILLGLYLVLSCSVNKPSTKDNSAVNFTILQKGNLYGSGSEEINEGLIVIKNFEEFHAIIDQMNSENPTADRSLVDDIHYFDHKMLLFIFDKLRGSGGYDLSVKRIYRGNAEIIVELETQSPNGPATSVMTQPFQIIEIDKCELPIILEIN